MADGFGTCVVQHVGSETRVMDAAERIRISPELLAAAAESDTPWVALDGPYIGFCGTHVYRATGESSDGCPVYELVLGVAGYQGPAAERGPARVADESEGS